MPRRNPDAEEGAVAVEFALVLTVLLVLLLGILSLGLQFGTRILAVQAASEGARAAVAGLSDAERQSLAAAAITATLDSYGGIATARTVSVAVGGSPTSSVRVTVTLDLSRFQLARFARLVPVASGQPTAVVTARVGGF
jgi:Flp pilus assembly protein TadG